MNLRRYLAKKGVYVVVTIFLIATLNFFIFQILPGDPTRVLIPRGGSSNVTGQNLRQQLIHEWGLDQPITQRFVIYMGNLVQGDFGKSITFRPGVPVLEVIGNRLVTTLILVGVATAMTAWIGMLLGRIAGWRRGRTADVAITLGGLAGYSMPTFWISLVLQFVLAVELGLLPVQGDRNLLLRNPDPFTDFVDRVSHLILPVATFVISNFAIFTLTLRNSLTDVLSEDYMLTARAKGLSEAAQLREHALPNARLPVVTVGAFYAGWIVSGAILIEIVFGLQGLGRLEWDAVLSLDYPLMSGIFLIATIGVVIANSVADVLYVILDPRVREA